MPRKPKPPPPVVPCAVASSTDVHTATVLLVAHCDLKPPHRFVRTVCDAHDAMYRDILATCPSCQRPTSIKGTAL